MDLVIMDYQWEIFLIIEAFGFLSLLLFGSIRYRKKRVRLSRQFIVVFIMLTAIEAVLAWYLYTRTGEISAFQMIVTLFVLYAITFGRSDFKKLDRWMRKKIDADHLLTEADYEEMKKQKDPTFQAKYYGLTWLVHVAVFLSVQVAFFWLSGLNWTDSVGYLNDLNWLGSDYYGPTPYENQAFYTVSMIWGIIVVVDAIIAATYVFQKKDRRSKEDV